VALWVPLVVAVVLIVLAVVLVAGKKTVNLGRGVDGATRVDVTITLCDQVARERRVDIVQAQKDFEDALRQQGAKEAHVFVDKPQCAGGPPSTR
jgi:preprotein translocase subunit SecF